MPGRDPKLLFNKTDVFSSIELLSLPNFRSNGVDIMRFGSIESAPNACGGASCPPSGWKPLFKCVVVPLLLSIAPALLLEASRGPLFPKPLLKLSLPGYVN